MPVPRSVEDPFYVGHHKYVADCTKSYSKMKLKLDIPQALPKAAMWAVGMFYALILAVRENQNADPNPPSAPEPAENRALPFVLPTFAFDWMHEAMYPPFLEMLAFLLLGRWIVKHLDPLGLDITWLYALALAFALFQGVFVEMAAKLPKPIATLSIVICALVQLLTGYPDGLGWATVQLVWGWLGPYSSVVLLVILFMRRSQDWCSTRSDLANYSCTEASSGCGLLDYWMDNVGFLFALSYFLYAFGYIYVTAVGILQELDSNAQSQGAQA